MTQLVRRLEREGLVTRLIDPEDARATLVAISDAGSAMRAELRQSLDDRLVELLSTMSPKEEAALGLAMRPGHLRPGTAPFRPAHHRRSIH